MDGTTYEENQKNETITGIVKAQPHSLEVMDDE